VRLQRLLDEVPADVVNYCDSAVGIASTTHPALCGVAAEISSRVAATIEQSVEDECDETYLVGHSLGSVIAIRTLLNVDTKSARIVGLITTGSPLRHLLRAYPDLVAISQ